MSEVVDVHRVVPPSELLVLVPLGWFADWPL
jgi:hypothetical protein